MCEPLKEVVDRLAKMMADAAFNWTHGPMAPKDLEFVFNRLILESPLCTSVVQSEEEDFPSFPDSIAPVEYKVRTGLGESAILYSPSREWVFYGEDAMLKAWKWCDVANKPYHEKLRMDSNVSAPPAPANHYVNPTMYFTPAPGSTRLINVTTDPDLPENTVNERRFRVREQQPGKSDFERMVGDAIGHEYSFAGPGFPVPKGELPLWVKNAHKKNWNEPDRPDWCVKTCGKSGCWGQCQNPAYAKANTVSSMAVEYQMPPVSDRDQAAIDFAGRAGADAGKRYAEIYLDGKQEVDTSKTVRAVRHSLLEAASGKDVVFMCISEQSLRASCAEAVRSLESRGIGFDTATSVTEDGVSTNVRLKSGGSVTFRWGGTSKGNPKFRILEDVDLPENEVRGYPAAPAHTYVNPTMYGTGAPRGQTLTGVTDEPMTFDEPPALTVWYRVTGAKAKMFLPAGIPLDVKPWDDSDGPVAHYCVDAPVSIGKYAGVAKRMTVKELDDWAALVCPDVTSAALGFECKSGGQCGLYEAGVAIRAMVAHGVKNLIVDIGMQVYSRHKQVRAIEFVRNVYKLAGGVCD